MIFFLYVFGIPFVATLGGGIAALIVIGIFNCYCIAVDRLRGNVW